MDPALIDDTFAAARAFFAQPAEIKLRSTIRTGCRFRSSCPPDFHTPLPAEAITSPDGPRTAGEWIAAKSQAMIAD